MANSLGAVFPSKTRAEWVTLNPLLMKGQGAYEEDTGALKIGNGTDVYNDLDYFVGAVQAVSPEQIEELIQQFVPASDQANKAYGTNSAGEEIMWSISSSPSGATLVLRGTGGTVQVGEATAGAHAVPKSQLDASLREVLLAGDKVVPLVGGNWYPIPGTGTTTTRATANNGESRFGRIVAGRDCTLDAMALEVTTAGTAGSLIRFGIYDFDPVTGAVGPLLLDAGTIEAESVGTKILNTSFPVKAGKHYLVGAAIQGNPATRPVLRAMVSNDVFLASSNAAQISSTGISNLTSTMTGPLPNTPGFGFGGSGALFRVMVRAAA
ncbi:tail protein [Gordonia phage Kabluna]|uniref:Uncharacterized protein n=2 Tax=Kablunavirus TaxID=2948776 RepID=A0A2D1GCY8_9CAUD|nr:tail protein [Gordonia phage Kabluna]YP_010101147.1 tail protein [Gordonia phage NosilaM]ATN89544.1 hypothetical protein SEA_KABLUNA_23 [Gordonia phage Kabluna]QAU07266.1 hypothetical protein SEA_NOSILAM_23 [Gordonia phage NosilaM]